MKLEVLIASTPTATQVGCASGPTPEGQYVKRIEDRYSEHREMRTAGGHDVVWNVRRTQHVFRTIGAESLLDMHASQNFGYHFVHSTPGPLREIAGELEHDGYQMVRLELVPNGDWSLDVRKQEVHSPETLHERNVQLSKLAEMRNVLYDGWNVEKK